MNEKEESRKAFFKNYFDSAYRQSNTFTKKEYEKSAYSFDLDFGNFLPLNKNAKILDIGCGTGHFLHFLMEKGYTNHFGIDMSQSQIKFCKKFITRCCETSDAFEYLKNKREVYSIISVNDVLEHIPKEKVIMFLEMIYLSLKRDAKLFLKLPNMSNPFALNNRYSDFTHECGFTEKSIYQVLYLAGFRKIMIKAPKISLKSIKNALSKLLFLLLKIFLKKLFWYQGFVAPKIVSSRLIVIAKK